MRWLPHRNCFATGTFGVNSAQDETLDAPNRIAMLRVRPSSLAFAWDATRTAKWRRTLTGSGSVSASQCDTADSDDGESATTLAAVTTTTGTASPLSDQKNVGKRLADTDSLSATSTFKRMRIAEPSTRQGGNETEAQQQNEASGTKLAELHLPRALARKLERARKHDEACNLSYKEVERIVEAAFAAGDAAARSGCARDFEQQLLDMQRTFRQFVGAYDARAFGHLPHDAQSDGGGAAACSYIA